MKPSEPGSPPGPESRPGLSSHQSAAGQVLSFRFPKRKRIILAAPFFAILGTVALWFGILDPRILSVEPLVPRPGDVLTIRGRNFGSGEGVSRVVLDGIVVPAIDSILWKSDTIMLRLPGSFDSGLTRVRTAFALSPPVMLITEPLLPHRLTQ